MIGADPNIGDNTLVKENFMLSMSRHMYEFSGDYNYGMDLWRAELKRTKSVKKPDLDAEPPESVN